MSGRLGSRKGVGGGGEGGGAVSLKLPKHSPELAFKQGPHIIVFSINRKFFIKG